MEQVLKLPYRFLVVTKKTVKDEGRMPKSGLINDIARMKFSSFS